MDLILWRHAEAEPGDPGTPDAARALTAKGRKQAARMGEWLDRALPGSCRVLSSPAVRTVQTVQALERKFKTHVSLAPGASAAAILEAARWPNAGDPVLVVGHQPALGQVASFLLAGVEQDWPLRKGAILWIAQKDTGAGLVPYIRAALGPDMTGR
ncbi:MAG TPA: histidine phosphatase family protein [Noviherbaspirillum sp.]|jgi:phosphohistidine phosphatase|uniref:SixA phosphatase family protein n=1 Tax=Noviherbaspirillum sp. TaxID=1926288 RepID=UPI002F930BD3